MVLTSRQVEIIRNILSGEYSTEYLSSCFTWSDTREGHGFWRQEAESSSLSQEAILALKRMVGESVQTPFEEKDEEPKMNLCLAEAYWNPATKVVDYIPTQTNTAKQSRDVFTPTPVTPDHPKARFKVAESMYTKPSSFFAAMDDARHVVWDLDNACVFGGMLSWASSFGVKNIEQFVSFCKQKAYETGYVYDYLGYDTLSESFSTCFSYEYKEDSQETFSDKLKALYFFAPRATEKGISFYASWRDSLRDRRSETSYGRFARKIFPKATDAEVEKFSDILSKQFIKRKFVMKEGKSRQDFAHAYGGKRTETLNLVTNSSRKSLANSCMRDKDWGLGYHPAEVYASGDFTIYWLETPEKGLIAGRVVVYHPSEEGEAPQAGPCYGVCEHSLDLLEAKLDEIGAVRYEDATWWGAKLLKVKVDGGYLMPYLDLCAEGVDDGDYFRLDKRGDYEFCGTEGYICGEESCTCEECGDRIQTDEAYSDPSGYYNYCEHCHSDLFAYCDRDNELYNRDEITFGVLTNSRVYLWGNRRSAEISVGPNYAVEECAYTDDLWLAEDMVEDADGNLVSPIYASDNLTQVAGVYYTSEQLAKHGLDEDGNEIAQEEGEAA